MSRFYEEAQERRLDSHIAGELKITPETLEEYPFQLGDSDNGLMLRLLWDAEAPPGVQAHGASGNLWTDVFPMHEPDGPDDID